MASPPCYFFRVASHRDKEFGRSDCWPNNDNDYDNDNDIIFFSELRVIATKSLEDRRNQRLCLKFGAKNIETIHLAEALLDDLINRLVS